MPAVGWLDGGRHQGADFAFNECFVRRAVTTDYLAVYEGQALMLKQLRPARHPGGKKMGTADGCSGGTVGIGREMKP